MLRRSTLSIVIASLFLLSPAGTAAQEEGSVEGVWVLEKVELEEQVIQEPAPAMFIFANGHYALAAVLGDSARSFANPESPTDAEKAEAYDRFAGSAGAYEIRGDSLVTRDFVAKDPGEMSGWPGNADTNGVSFKGDRVILDLGEAVLTLRRVSEEAPLPR